MCIYILNIYIYISIYLYIYILNLYIIYVYIYIESIYTASESDCISNQALGGIRFLKVSQARPGTAVSSSHHKIIHFIALQALGSFSLLRS